MLGVLLQRKLHSVPVERMDAINLEPPPYIIVYRHCLVPSPGEKPREDISIDTLPWIIKCVVVALFTPVSFKGSKTPLIQRLG